MPDNISPHCTYREATQSLTATRLGLKNVPGPLEIANMQRVAAMCFEPARTHFGQPIYISSFYRSPKVNAAIGGAAKSQHRTGEAIDLDCDVYGGLTNADLFYWLQFNVDFDQIIWEYGTVKNPEWVHVSYRAGANRGTVLRAVRVNGKTAYRPWSDV